MENSHCDQRNFDSVNQSLDAKNQITLAWCSMTENAVASTPVAAYTIVMSKTVKFYWTSREDSLELIELSSINKVSLGFLL